MDEKYNIRSVHRRSGAGVLFMLLLTALSIYIFTVTLLRYYDSVPFFFKGYVLFIALYSFLLILFMAIYNAFEFRRFRTRELICAFALASLLTNGITYIIMSLSALQLLQPLALIVATLIQWMVGLGIYVLARVLLPRLESTVRVLYLRSGSGEGDGTVTRKFDSLRTNYTISATADGNMPWDDLKYVIDRYETVLVGDVSPEARQRILGYCFRTGREALLIPRMDDVLLGSASSMVMGDSLLYSLNTEGHDLWYRFVKRLADIVLSGLGLLVLSPVLLFTALAVKLQDGGPVFYRQVRLTEGGRPFKLMKFRSMIVNAESKTGAVLAGKSDDRITKVGKVIRATRLDELPQLFNILKGDMSLVGPRPERPEFYEKICREFPAFDYRLKVKAGLTGYAQLYGKYNTTFEDKAKLDLYYIQHASPLWDMQLILYTLKIIFIKESSEGVEGTVAAGQKTGAEKH